MAKAWHMIAAAALILPIIPIVAHASGWNVARFSEDGNFSLFLAGIAGVLIGRRSSRVRRGGQSDTSA